MAPFPKLLLILLIISVSFPSILAEYGVVLQAAEQLQQLNAKISSLETSIEGQSGELKLKDGSIKQLESVIDEKSNSLAELHSVVRSLKEKGDVQERIREVNARVNELDKQIISLKREIEAQNKKKEKLEARAVVAEEKIEGMNLKYENLRKINDEQKLIIRNAQNALQVAEEKMLKVRLEASSVTKQLEEVRQGWLPPWLSAHLVHFQPFVITQWNEHGRPALDLTIQKVRKQKSEVEKWVHPHFKTLRTKWLPTIKKHCKSFVDDFDPVVRSLSRHAVDYYNVVHSTIKPHIVKIQEIVGPHFEETKMLVKPYINQVLEIAKPHVEKALLLSKPYTKKVVRYHRKITKNVRIYHSRVQANLHETLQSYELTRPLATERIVWFMASGIMAMPLIVLFRMLPQKEPKKRPRGTNRSHTRRRAKRVHHDR